MLKKLPKKLIMIVGPLVFVAALVFFVLPKVSIQIGSAQPGTPGTTVEVVPTEIPHEDKHGIPLPLTERVVNLADAGGYRYLKVELVLDLYAKDAEHADDAGGGGGGGHGAAAEEVDPLVAAQTHLASELGPITPQMHDIVTTVLTSRTVADVSTAAGKEAVKAELMAALAPLLEEHHQELLAIYFQQFLIQ